MKCTRVCSGGAGGGGDGHVDLAGGGVPGFLKVLCREVPGLAGVTGRRSGEQRRLLRRPPKPPFSMQPGDRPQEVRGPSFFGKTGAETFSICGPWRWWKAALRPAKKEMETCREEDHGVLGRREGSWL